VAEELAETGSLRARLDAGWAEFRGAVAALSSEDVERRTPAGWTVKEMLAHVAFWEETGGAVHRRHAARSRLAAAA
jgi:Mycothiol maleylpyruvate isomerase N-terminal domain